ncbi:hypothetical protein [Oceanisphaera litoralis]|uniref:hypothetical protein n=1 Tax=Oceanisphaera litoralis TaxID=225144 RepID=UPI001EF76142|nr:hypothetical protein [Oceanisphaera litoralis]
MEERTHCQEASDLAEYKLWDMRKKIDRLEKIEKVLAEMVDQCHAQQGDITCPLIATLHDGIRGTGDHKG